MVEVLLHVHVAAGSCLRYTFNSIVKIRTPSFSNAGSSDNGLRLFTCSHLSPISNQQSRARQPCIFLEVVHNALPSHLL